jgi:hypothetical protein
MCKCYIIYVSNIIYLVLQGQISSITYNRDTYYKKENKTVDCDKDKNGG